MNGSNRSNRLTRPTDVPLNDSSTIGAVGAGFAGGVSVGGAVGAGSGVSVRAGGAVGAGSGGSVSAGSRKAAAYRTRWGIWSVLAAGWILGITAIWTRGGAVEWFMTAVITAIALLCGLFPFLATAGIYAVRSVSTNQLDGGDEVRVSLSVKRAWPIPFVWLDIQDIAVNETAIRSSSVSFRSLRLTPMQSESSITYILQNLGRGRHRFDGVTVTAGDWLGLTAVRKRLPEASEVLVLPKAPAINQSISASVSVISGESGQPVSAEQRNDAIAAELRAAMGREGIGPDSRPYREGDSLRHVDWRSAARGIAWQTKLHGYELPARRVIALDTLAASYDRNDQLFDTAVSWTALALEEAIVNGHEALLLTGQSEKVNVSNYGDERPEASSRTAWQESTKDRLVKLQRQLAELRAGESSALLNELKDCLQAGVRDTSLFVFTGDWRSGAAWCELAALAAEHGCRVHLCVVVNANVPTFAMRETQKWLESSGIKISWLHDLDRGGKLPSATEGGAAHADFKC